MSRVFVAIATVMLSAMFLACGGGAGQNQNQGQNPAQNGGGSGQIVIVTEAEKAAYRRQGRGEEPL